MAEGPSGLGSLLFVRSNQVQTPLMNRSFFFFLSTMKLDAVLKTALNCSLRSEQKILHLYLDGDVSLVMLMAWWLDFY